MDNICRYHCSRVAITEGMMDGQATEVFEVTFTPVSSGPDQDKQNFIGTPAGNLVIQGLHKCPFVVGKEYNLSLDIAG